MDLCQRNKLKQEKQALYKRSYWHNKSEIAKAKNFEKMHWKIS